METVTVDAKALHSVLVALNGPGHLIRELQATRNLHAMGDDYANPIETLVEQFNAQVLAQEAKTQEGERT